MRVLCICVLEKYNECLLYLAVIDFKFICPKLTFFNTILYGIAIAEQKLNKIYIKNCTLEQKLWK